MHEFDLIISKDISDYFSEESMIIKRNKKRIYIWRITLNILN